MSTKKGIVFAAISGGVDSAVAAALLKEQGYDVVGVFMRQYDMDIEEQVACSQREDRKDAMAVAAHLGIPFEEWDFRKEYHRDVIRYMLSEYKAGRTPNPDVMCNTHVKFGAFLKKARSRKSDSIATGHYVRRGVTKRGSKTIYTLQKAKDRNKDQSYFLYGLSQEQLRSCIFPIGLYTKPKVRELAQSFGLPNALKKDSQGICFIGKISMADYLADKIHMKPGRLMTLDGHMVGEHKGAGYYTLGQRHGLGFGGGGETLYVVGKDMKKNIVYVGAGERHPALYLKETLVKDLNWIAGTAPRMPLSCMARTRYRQDVQRCTVRKVKNGYLVTFARAQRAVTPGQALVWYVGDEMLGGGSIE